MTTPATQFAVDSSTFVERKLAELTEHASQIAENAAVAKAHIAALRKRLDDADEALDVLHVGLAGSYLAIGQRDMDAARRVLPQ